MGLMGSDDFGSALGELIGKQAAKHPLIALAVLAAIGIAAYCFLC